MSIVEVRVTLDNVEPVVERILLLPLSLRLDRLHLVLQVAMGWHNCHMHMFEAGDMLGE